MEEDSAQAHRLIIAAILCFLALAGWQHFFFKPPATPTKGPGSSSPSAQVSTSTKTAEEPTPIPEAPEAPGAEPEAAPVAADQEPAPEPEEVKFTGAVEDPVKGKIPYELVLTNVGGALERFDLPTFTERDEKNRPTDLPISLANPVEKVGTKDQMAAIDLVDAENITMPKKPVYRIVEKTDKMVRFSLKTPEGVIIEREFSRKTDSFELEMAVTIRNESSKPTKHRLKMQTALQSSGAMEAGGFLFMPPPDHLNALCFSDGKAKREAQKKLVKKGPETIRDAVKWVGIDRQYFLAAIVQRDGVAAECELSAEDKTARAALILPEVKLAPGEEKRHKFTAYFGVKKPELLSRVDSELESAIDYTVIGLNLAIICELLLFLMGIFHSATGSWGVAILGLTVLVKSVLFPLNQRSGRSMKVMSALKPELDGLKEKFPDDRQRQSEEMMRLYRKHNVNPASGCVPILLQMPIWFALYRALWVAVDLYQEPFLWMPDLTARDPYFILPVVLVGVMFLQQKMTPTAMDPAQQKMMLYVMPLMFGSFMIGLPAGLCFYILVNSLLTIVQQHLINKSTGLQKSSPSAQGAGT